MHLTTAAQGELVADAEPVFNACNDHVITLSSTQCHAESTTGVQPAGEGVQTANQGCRLQPGAQTALLNKIKTCTSPKSATPSETALRVSKVLLTKTR